MATHRHALFAWKRRCGKNSRVMILLAVLLAMLPATARVCSVSAYCRQGKTAIGTRTRRGICAGPRKYLCRFVRIAGRRYQVEDICGRGFDIWMPTQQACRQFGRRQLEVVIGGSFLHPK